MCKERVTMRMIDSLALFVHDGYSLEEQLDIPTAHSAHNGYTE